MKTSRNILLIDDCEYTKTIIEEYCRKIPDLNFSHVRTSSFNETLPPNSNKSDIIIFDPVLDPCESNQRCLHKKTKILRDLSPDSKLIIFANRRFCTCPPPDPNQCDSDIFFRKETDYPMLFEVLKDQKPLPDHEKQIPQITSVQSKLDPEVSNILHLSIEQSLSSIIITDTNGNFEYANPAFYEVTGFSRDQIIGKTPRILKSGKHPQAFYKNIWETVKSGKEWKGSICNKKKNGELYWIYQSITPIKSESGEIIKFLAVRLDDTARRKAEKKAQTYSNELARSNKDLAEFASIASHDLQEPLRRIVSFTDLMATKIPVESDVLVSYMEKVRNSTLRMKELLNDLLLFSYVNREAKKNDVIHLEELVNQITQDLEIKMRETGGSVLWNGDRKIRGDAVQLRQVLQNLITNALKFHREEVPPVINIYCQIKKGFYEISVQDNGIGFDEKFKEKIFHPFQRLHGRGEYQGTGMGLAICRKIIERHGGTITVKSTLGTGTTFNIKLPKQPLSEIQL